MNRLATTTQSAFAGSKKESQLRAVRTKLGKDGPRKVYKSHGSLREYLEDHKDDKI